MIYVTVFFCGMAVMALELAASRLFAPYFGSTIHVWAGLIGALLFFLAAGNFLGGRMSRAGAGLKKLYGIVMAAALAGAAAPYLARPVMIYFSAAAGRGESLLPGILVSSAATLAVPLVLLGCVLPLATGILTKEAGDAGRTAGALYALSTIGSIAGVFLPALVTLPLLGTRLTFLVFSAAAGAAAAAGLARAGAALLLLAFVPFYFIARSAPVRPEPDDGVRLHEEETLYNYIQITRAGDLVKMEIDQGWFTYSKYLPGSVFTDSYRDYVPLAWLLSGEADFPRKVCILGLAGGSDARVLKHVFPGTHVTGVEIDPRLVELGREYMGLKGELDRLAIADGRAFLRGTDEKFDFILVDVYNQAYIPFHMATKEFFELARGRLAPGGVFAMNVAWRTADDWELPHILAATLNEAFPTVYIQMFRLRSNTILYAADRDVPVETVAQRMAAPENPHIRDLISKGVDKFGRYSGGEDITVFTDDRAPVEMYTDITIRKFFSDRAGKNI